MATPKPTPTDSTTPKAALTAGFSTPNTTCMMACTTTGISNVVSGSYSGRIVVEDRSQSPGSANEIGCTLAPQRAPDVIRNSGRPVIVVPLDYEGPEIGSNVVLGWSDTREATRAAHDLLIVAENGASVTVLRVGGEASDALSDSDGIDLSEALSRHRLKPTLERRDPVGHSVAEVLNQTAFEKGADLIVTGAFGHSRAYDFVLGATTYALLKEAKLPVLFSK